MLYFLPGLSRAQLTPTALTGLHPDLHDAAQLVCCDVTGKGPSGTSGVVVADHPHSGYHPERQTWHHVAGLWVGWQDSPTPASLQRPIQIDGYLFELGDGQQWMCPVLRVHGIRLNLPSTWGLDAAGNFSQQVLPGYEDEIELAEKIWQHVNGEPLTKPEAFSLCARLLAVNYRLSPAAVSALGLITSDNYQRVFQAAIDGPAIQALMQDKPAVAAAIAEMSPEKKTTPGPDGTPPG